jgi:ketosteroid isomerase-like protein
MDRLAAVRGVYERWERDDYRAGLELYDPEVRLEVHNPIPDAAIYQSVEGLQSYMRRFLTTWDEYHLEGVEFEENGDRVVVRVHHGGLGRASGVRVAMDYYMAWTFKGDRVTRLDIGASPDVGA